MFSSAKAEEYTRRFCEDSDVCETNTLRAPLGSSVFLPCKFSISPKDWVSWVHIPEMDLVHLTPKGLVKFTDPRNGRVKVFPNQGSEGNYSICISELVSSDLGCYLCTQGEDCLQVELVAEGTWSTIMLMLVYTCASVALTLLITFTYCCVKHTLRNNNQNQANQQSIPTRTHCNPTSAVMETQPRSSRNGIYPDLNQINFEQTDNLRGESRFHTELFRLPQASLSQHYYVNQGDISKQHARNHHRGLGRKKVRENCEYKNPIYNRSTDQLSRL
ncbi:uncharacterized protein [Antennarius striatus]|uniref:uncharacterized protein n=1 Tax=Antennarius striatus TaxID=241820 RepID=UPI0035B08C02